MANDFDLLFKLKFLYDLCVIYGMRLSKPLFYVHLLTFGDPLVDKAQEYLSLMRLQDRHLLHQGKGVMQGLPDVVVKTFHEVGQRLFEVKISTVHD